MSVFGFQNALNLFFCGVLFPGHFFDWSIEILMFEILWATPSAAGPRSLPIASGLQILGIVCKRVLVFLGREPVI